MTEDIERLRRYLNRRTLILDALRAAQQKAVAEADPYIYYVKGRQAERLIERLTQTYNSGG